MNNRTGQKAFTLIEVMLAMAVFAIAGVALLGTTDTNLTGMSRIEDQTMAQWVAANQLVEANLSTKWPPQNNQRGEQELAGITWYWQQKVIATTDKNMKAITIEVRRNQDSESAITSLTTYVTKAQSGAKKR